jgi:hypothetical protein
MNFALRIAVEILFEEREKIETKSLMSLLAKTPLSFFLLLFVLNELKKNKKKLNTRSTLKIKNML